MSGLTDVPRGETSARQITRQRKGNREMNNKDDGSRKACQICGRSEHLVPASSISSAVADLIRKESGKWFPDGWICREDLGRFRQLQVRSILEDEKGELTVIDQEVLDSMKNQELVSANVESQFEGRLSWGQRLADRVAGFGGSWRFMLLFAFLLFAWMAVNSLLLIVHPFDPYPYILLNLVLSCLAAIQAPVIMMSQNRQEDRDRLRSIQDYKVNLKSELEIRHLHQKVDHLLTHQWERLIKIQEIQMDLIREIGDDR